MDSLSDELLCSILAHLDPWTLSRSVQYVSKRLRRLALENRLWYTFTRPDPSYILASKPLYTHWMDIDWHNEWKWQEPALGCFANDARRNAPLRTTFIDDSVTVLTFGLHRSDIVALTDDGSLRRWRKSDSQWQEISHTKSLAGRESFRIRRTAGCGNRVSSTTQLGYNDAIAMGDESIFFGVGQSLQKLARFRPRAYRLISI
jgi:F-box-like